MNRTDKLVNGMSRSFLVDSLIGNNSPPAYPLPYYGNQLPSYMFNFFNLGLGYQPIRPVPRPPAMPVPVPISPPALANLRPMPGQSPPSPFNTSASRLSGKSLLQFFFSAEKLGSSPPIFYYLFRRFSGRRVAVAQQHPDAAPQVAQFHQ